MRYKASTKEDYLRRINIITEYVNNHLSESVDLNALAEISGFSPWHFHRITRAFLGEPIGAYIIRIRLETAARLLRHSDMNIDEIAYRVGYDVPSSLSKAFMKHYFVSPTNYRNDKSFIIMKPIDRSVEVDVTGRIEEQPAKRVIYKRLTGPYNSHDYARTWQVLSQYLADSGYGRWCPEYIAIYHDDPKVTGQDKLRTDICFTAPADVVPRGEIGVKEIRGGRYGIFTYRGTYDHLGVAYDRIYHDLIPDMQVRIADAPAFEVYLNDPRDTRPEELATAIYVPVE